MMFMQKISTDERARSNTRYAAAVWLGVTQVLLAGVIFYRLYVLGQPDEDIRDFQAVLAISLFGYMGLQLFLGGVMPVLTWKGMVAAYLILAGVIVAGCLVIYGWPAIDQWADTWLPALMGPAILVAAYASVARLGQWRIEREIRILED